MKREMRVLTLLLLVSLYVCAAAQAFPGPGPHPKKRVLPKRVVPVPVPAPAPAPARHTRSYTKVDVYDRTYYYYGGVFYVYTGYDYVVVTPPIGAVVSVLPSGAVRVVIDGTMYYRHGDVYYRRCQGGYLVVATPLGGSMSSLPVGCTTVVIDDAVYYRHHNSYFAEDGNAYVVVRPPVEIVDVEPEPAAPGAVAPESVDADPAPEQTESTEAGTGDTLDETEYIVNIPNGKGGYTPVVLRIVEGGYIGPQGEFYPAMPSVAQLKAMYGEQPAP